MEPEAKPVVLPVECHQAALAHMTKGQTDAFAISDARVVENQALTEAHETFDNLTKESRGSKDALALLRYGADVEAELRESTAQWVNCRRLFPIDSNGPTTWRSGFAIY